MTSKAAARRAPLICSCGRVTPTPPDRITVAVRAGRLVIVWRCDGCPIGLRSISGCAAGIAAAKLSVLGVRVPTATLAAAVRLADDCRGRGGDMRGQ